MLRNIATTIITVVTGSLRLPTVLSASAARCDTDFTVISQYRLVFYLPDKGFRYLGTVIVTAAVYQGFSLMLFRQSELHLPLTFWHRAGVTPYTSSYDLAERCVFIKQSPGPLHCARRSPPKVDESGTSSPEVTR